MRMLLQELEVWYVIPALRRALALEFRERGMRAVEIAQRLGVTKAAVSQYFHRERAVSFIFDKKINNEIKLAVDRIVNGKNSNSEIQRLLMLLRETRAICRFHRRQDKDIGKHCDICFQDLHA
jgi:hypothetical protein